MTSLALITVAGNNTGAVTLPGTAGAADSDLYVQIAPSPDLAWEVSQDAGTTWSDGLTGGNTGVQVMVPKGGMVRIRNSNGAARKTVPTYRYKGEPG